ncbi:MAG: MoaD/ThiS family protein [Acidimicrobiales bacterium]
MEVRVRVPTALRDLCAGRSTLAVNLEEVGEVGEGAATVDDLLDAIGAVHPALERRIRDEQGVLRTHVNLFVGEDNVRSLAGGRTELRTGDEVSILAAISGG